MTCIPASVRVLLPIAWYPHLAQGWKGLHLDVHDGILEGARQNHCRRCFSPWGGGAIKCIFLADNFVYNVIYLVSVHIHDETAHNYHAHLFRSVAGCWHSILCDLSDSLSGLQLKNVVTYGI
jgi:hypothetical protein